MGFWGGGSVSLHINAPVADALTALARTNGSTLFTVMLAAFNVLLSRYSGAQDLVVGTPVSGRNHLELEGIIGFFLNTLAIRTDVSGQPSFNTLVERVREIVPFLQDRCIITDAGSVKGPLVDEIDTLIPNALRYVGAHPIAGGEQSGLEAASADLLTGAKCIITPTAKTQTEALERVTEFWSEVGMQTLTMDAHEHDTVWLYRLCLRLTESPSVVGV